MKEKQMNRDVAKTDAKIQFRFTFVFSFAPSRLRGLIVFTYCDAFSTLHSTMFFISACASADS